MSILEDLLDSIDRRLIEVNRELARLDAERQELTHLRTRYESYQQQELLPLPAPAADSVASTNGGRAESKKSTGPSTVIVDVLMEAGRSLKARDLIDRVVARVESKSKTERAKRRTVSSVLAYLVNKKKVQRRGQRYSLPKEGESG